MESKKPAAKDDDDDDDDVMVSGRGLHVSLF